MANLLFKNQTIKVDNAAGTLTDITAYLTSESIKGMQEVIDQSTMTLEEKSYLPGQAGATTTLAGVVNSTTDAMFGALIGNRTTATKTIQNARTTNLVYRGEWWVTDVEYSGAVNTLQTFSASATLEGVMIKTSVAL